MTLRRFFGPVQKNPIARLTARGFPFRLRPRLARASASIQKPVVSSAPLHRAGDTVQLPVLGWENHEFRGARVETLTVRLKYLGRGFLALVFMIGTLAGLAAGFLALLAFRLAGGGD